MTELLLELVNVLIPYFSGFAVLFYPMWETRNAKARSVLIFLVCNTLYLCIGLLLFKQTGAISISALNMFKLCAGLPAILAPFFVFHKRVWQNIFLLAMCFPYSLIPNGIGLYASENWFVFPEHPLLTANIVSIVVAALTLPPLLYILRRLYENTHMKQAVIFWRLIWLLPMSFFAIAAQTSSYFFSDKAEDAGFVIVRVLIYGALLLTCYLLEAAILHVSENVSLKEHARMTERQLHLQREQYARLAENEESAKRMRHDIRYHLALIVDYHNSGESEKLGDYLARLAEALPSADEKKYCMNFAVNAVVARYAAVAERCGIRADIKLDIPEKTGKVHDMDLCVIMGNLLENAIEACLRVGDNKKFVKVRSAVDRNFLTIVVENSFDGLWLEEGGVYLSRKEFPKTRESGVGLSSVRAICEKNGGLMRIEINGQIWKTSALVYMTAETWECVNGTPI